MNRFLALLLISLTLIACVPAEARSVHKRRNGHHKQLRATYVKEEEPKPKAFIDSNEDEDDDDDDDDDELSHSAERDKLERAVKAAKTKLANNKAKEAQMRGTLKHLEDETASDIEIDVAANLVANETQSNALASMMGNMWKELRMFSLPTWSQHAKEEIAREQKLEIKLQADVDKAVTELESSEKRWAAEEDEDEKDDREKKPLLSPQAVAQGESQSLKATLKKADFTIEEVKVPTPQVFPVPTTSRCIVILVVQCMVVYAALALCRTFLEIRGMAPGVVEAGLCAAAQTLTYAPMLCVLFIACRMRVEFLSDGKDEPQEWVQNCMYALTFAVLASTFLVLMVTIVTGRPLKLREGSGDLEKLDVRESGSKAAFYLLTAARYLILLLLYGGLVGVIVGICTYVPPGATGWRNLPAPAPAVTCTMILSVVFFAAQLAIACCRTYTEFTEVEFPRVVGTMRAAANTVEFAPQLAILFLAARMRALQHDGQPQAWAQTCMYFATGALCLSALLSCLIPLVMMGAARSKEARIEVSNSPKLGFALQALRLCCLLAFYGGAVGVIVSIFSFESPKGPEHTLPVSPTVQCVVNLTCQFFAVYVIQFVMLTITEVSGRRVQMDRYRLYSAVDAAKSTLHLAPMLCILFVTVRMYALLITDKKGAPQAWVQDGMYMATWSLMISFLACLATGLCVDNVETDDDGNVVNKFNNKCAAYTAIIVRYLAMILLYSGIIMVIVGLFVMTPETANGRGSVPVVSDVVDSTPVGEAPPGPQQVMDAGPQTS